MWDPLGFLSLSKVASLLCPIFDPLKCVEDKEIDYVNPPWEEKTLEQVSDSSEAFPEPEELSNDKVNNNTVFSMCYFCVSLSVATPLLHS